MVVRHSNYAISKPITVGGRLILPGCMLLVAFVLGFAASGAFYQMNRDALRQSDALGYLLCGDGQHVDDVPSGSKGTRMICRDPVGVEVSARNNFVAVNMALPFIVLFAMPGMMLAWMVDWHRRHDRRSPRSDENAGSISRPAGPIRRR